MNAIQVSKFSDLESMNLTELSRNEIQEVEGGKWGFIGRMAVAALGTSVGVALIAGIVVGYIGYKVYEYYTTD